MIYGSGGNPISARDEATVAALARALVRTGMYIDAGIDTSAGLDAPRVYAMALLTDPLLAEDGVHFISILRDDEHEKVSLVPIRRDNASRIARPCRICGAETEEP